MATLTDIAKVEGVSAATASLALFSNGLDPQTGFRRVSLRKQKRILDAAQRMGYQPSLVARAMKQKQTLMVALVVNGIHGSFYPEIIEGITDVIESEGYNLIICHSRESHEREARHLSILQQKRIDGVIVAPVLTAGDSRLAEKIPEFGDRPVVMLGSNPLRHPLAVVLDDVDCGSQAARHLLALGHRKIAFVPMAFDCPHSVDDVMKIAPMRDRYEGYAQAMRAEGLAPRIILNSAEFIDGLKRRSISAAFVSADEVADSVYRCVVAEGFRVPTDVSVVGVDDMPIAKWLDPPLTTLRQPKAELGEQAARLVLTAIENGEPAFVTLKATLIQRASGRQWT